MKLRSMLSLAAGLWFVAGAAFAQPGPGSSPLTPAKGGTNSAYVGFTGPTTSVKTFTLPDASDTIATLNAARSWTALQTFSAMALTNTQNGLTSFVITNQSTGTGALASTIVRNSAGDGAFGLGGTGHTTTPALQNKVYVYAESALGGIILYNAGAKPIDFYVNGARAGGFTSAGLFTLPTPLALTEGGSGAATAAGARTNFGLVIGVDVQAYDAELAALAGLTSANNKCFYWTGSGTAATYDCSSFGRSVANAADASALRTLAGAVIGTNVQAWDTDLDCLAALSTGGLVSRTGAGTCAVRTITAPAAGFTFNNADGVGGNPTAVLANDLAAVEGLSGTGCAARTATDTWATRTITGTANQITVANGDCVGGNPTISIPSNAALPGAPTTTTASANDNSTKVATTAYVDTADALKANAANSALTGLTNVGGAIKFSTQSAPAQITSNANDYNPSSVVCATSSTLLINSDAARDVTGLAGGVAGCEMRLVNNGPFTITLKEQSVSSTAVNRFNTGGDIALASNAAVTLLYEGGTTLRWRMASPASAGGGGAGTVTSVVCGGTTITTSGNCYLPGQVVGTATNDNATAGNIGEYIDTSTGAANATATVTMTIGSPCVVTWTDHKLTLGATTAVRFTTTGSLATNVVSGTTYYAKAIDANTFNIATSAANALAGTFITTTGSQSGVHTAFVYVSMVAGAAQDLAAVSLAAGDWEVSGQVLVAAASTTTVTYVGGGLSLVSNTIDRTFGRRLSTEFSNNTQVVGNAEFSVFNVGPARFSLSATTTVFVHGQSNFGTSTLTSSGWIRARRIR